MVQMDSSNKPCAYCRIVQSEFKPEVVSKVQKMAQYALFCLIIGPFKGEVPVFARLWPVMVRVRVSFTTGAVRSAILATAGLLVRPLLVQSAGHRHLLRNLRNVYSGCIANVPFNRT